MNNLKQTKKCFSSYALPLQLTTEFTSWCKFSPPPLVTTMQIVVLFLKEKRSYQKRYICFGRIFLPKFTNTPTILNSILSEVGVRGVSERSTETHLSIRRHIIIWTDMRAEAWDISRWCRSTTPYSVFVCLFVCFKYVETHICNSTARFSPNQFHL